MEMKSVKEIRNERGSLSTDKGVYKWWCKQAEIEQLLKPLGIEWQDVNRHLEKKGDVYCFYVGQTKNKKGFAKRIKGQHLRLTKNSTLRRSLKALFGGEQIDTFLDDCFVSLEKVDEANIDDKERKEINAHLRLLNIKNLEDTSNKFRKEIVEVLKNKRQKKN
ncbi:MAG: hypothetical protein IKB98_02595 [Clostridia bacterium]|nr:hypothetical protein [Clostridia bacterium]